MAVLRNGETYYVFLDAEGSGYQRGRYIESGQYPHSSADVDITTGVYTSRPHTSSDGRYNIVSVEAILDASDPGNPVYGTTTTTPNDDGPSDVSASQGIGFEPRADLDGIRPTISAAVEGVTRAFIQDANRNRLAETDISGLSAGDSFDIITAEGGEGGDSDTDPGQQLGWSSTDDWQNATGRSNVVTQTFGVRSSDQIQQGWDPDHPPLNDADAYWPLDETSGSTAEDAIGNANGTFRNGGTAGIRGLLGSNAISFNGSNQYVDFGEPNVLMQGGSFSVMMGVRRANTSDREILMSVGFNSPGDWRLEVRDNARLYFSYVDSSGNFNGATFHFGNMTTNLHYVGLTYSGDAAAVYLDGDRDAKTIGGSGRPRPSRPAALARYGDRDGFFYSGDLTEVVYSNTPYSASAHRDMRGVLTNGGWLETHSQSQHSAPESITTNATVPANTSCSLEVRQNTSGGGSADNTQTINVGDGTRTYDLSSFSGSEGASYSLRVDVDTNDITRSAIFEGATIQFEDVARSGGTVFRTSNGVLVTNDGVIQTT